MIFSKALTNKKIKQGLLYLLLFFLYYFSFSNEIVKDPFAFQGLFIFGYYIILFKNVDIINKWFYFALNIILNFLLYLWLFNTIHFFGQINIFISLFAILLIASYLSIYQQLFFLFIKTHSKYIIFSPLIYLILELIRGWLLSGFTFNLIGYSLYKFRFLIYPARLFTVYGVGFFIILFSLLIGYKLNKIQKYFVIILLLIYIIPSFFIIFEKNNFPNIKILLLETNFQPEDKKTDDFGVFKKYHYDPTQKIFKELSLRPDVVVWSETAVPFIFNKNYYIEDTLINFSKINNISLIFGSEYYDGNNFYNSSYWIKNGIIENHYDKEHLVIFGEYFPLKKIWPFNKLYGQFRDFTPGKRVVLFDIKGIRIFTPICYEIAFGKIIKKAKQKGANIIINLSNDGWYGFSSGPYSEMAFSVFRAIESRVYVMRAINRGWAVIVSPKGKILYKNSPKTPGFILFNKGKVSFINHPNI